METTGQRRTKDDFVKRRRTRQDSKHQTADLDALKAADRIEQLEKALLDIFDYECRESSQSLIANTARDALWPKKLEKPND